jgi:hypothetical protein
MSESFRAEPAGVPAAPTSTAAVSTVVSTAQ